MGTYILFGSILALMIGLGVLWLLTYKRMNADIADAWDELIEVIEETHNEMLTQLKTQKKELSNVINVKLYGDVPDPEVSNDRTAYLREAREASVKRDNR